MVLRTYCATSEWSSFFGPMNGPIKTADIIADWSDCVLAKGDPGTILVFDSYYLSAEGRHNLQEKRVAAICSVESGRFSKLHSYVKQDVEKPGEWSGVFKDPDIDSFSGEMYNYVWSTDTAIGKKCVYANCFKRRKRKRGENDGPTSRTVIPAYDHYNSLFSMCDNFNRALHDRTWPHKHGGSGVAGDLGHQHNFALSIVLQNTFNAYNCAHGIDTFDFREYCENLADQLIEFSLTF